MEGLVWSTINYSAAQPSPAPLPTAEPLLQVAEVTMGNNSNEVTDYAIIINRTPIEQNIERKCKQEQKYTALLS